ncbi:hypothetical protein PM082_016704 [Marasmius tenuissimus]|nr:hypothetical protein PM082_016704 [Marasmius tenuissimus]
MPFDIAGVRKNVVAERQASPWLSRTGSLLPTLTSIKHAFDIQYPRYSLTRLNGGLEAREARRRKKL